MSKFEVDVTTGIYKCKGNINNLRIKIRLEIIKSSVIPLSNEEEGKTGLDRQNNEIEECELSWQQKIFSRHELRYYSDQKNCITSTDEDYHDEAIKLISNNQEFPKNLIFSYTVKDDISQLQKGIFFNDDVKQSIQENPSLLNAACNTVRDVASVDHAIPRRNIVDYNPTDELRIQNRTSTSFYRLMHVLVDLSDKNSNVESKHLCETDSLLVSIKWDPRTSTLSVSPDFISFDSPGYKIENDAIRDTRYEYRYWVGNISQKDQSSIERLSYQIPLIHQPVIQMTGEFTLPENNLLEIFIFAEIQKATGFEYNDLFIQYFIHLPEGWLSESELNGSTQRSCYGKMEETVVFSHLFEVELSFQLNKSMDRSLKITYDNTTELRAPQIFMEVCSLDNFGVYRVEGYAWTTVPLTPGSYSLILNTWRPSTEIPVDEMIRYFVGWHPHLADHLYPGFGTNESSLLSRYGFQTVSSGDVYLKLNIMRQFDASMSGLDDVKKSSLFSGHMSTSAVMNSISSILEAFKKARQRMLVAREPLLLHTDK